MKWAARIQEFLRQEDGASVAEYGLLIAGIAVALMIVFFEVGAALNAKFTTLQNRLGGTGSGP
jgi:Flp pilus assembly pilin Flp